MSKQVGKIIQVVGPVVDVEFELGGLELPDILDSLEIKRENGEIVTIECQQHIGENTIRCISMDSTDGLMRGMDVQALGSISYYDAIGRKLKRTFDERGGSSNRWFASS